MIQVIICCKNLYVKLKDSGLMGMVVLYTIHVVRTVQYLIVQVYWHCIDTDPDSGSSQFFIRIRIQGNDTDSTDPDPPYWSRTTESKNCQFPTLCQIFLDSE